MNNLTKMKINKPAHDVFEAFADPAKIGNFWFLWKLTKKALMSMTGI
jgi:uncharacterized protein YndB with AHSA1/START domain